MHGSDRLNEKALCTASQAMMLLRHPFVVVDLHMIQTWFSYSKALSGDAYKALKAEIYCEDFNIKFCQLFQGPSSL